MFEKIFECSPLALILVDESGAIRLLNKEAELLFGYERDELVNQPIEVLIPQEFREMHPSLRQFFFKNPSSRAMGKGRNLFGLRKDKKTFPIEVGLNPIEFNGSLFVVSSIIDISARMSAEEKFRTAFEAAPNGMIMVDKNGQILLVNELIEKMFGYNRLELVGMPIEVLVPTEFRERHPRFMKAYMEAPSPRAMGAGRDLFARRKDGSKFPVEIGLRPFSGPEGLCVISSIVDITERLKDREKLMSRNEELQQFSYRTSHDLKAPLISIKGLAEFIVDDIRDGAMQEASLNAEKIVRLSDKLKGLLEDILELTKADYLQEEVQEINFAEVLETAVMKFEILCKEKQVEVKKIFAHSHALISQPTVITQIIDNLISNALKYADKNKENRFVCVKTYNDIGRFYIQVQDNGLGIPPERNGEVFGMFKRFHKESIQGSGLGLYMVKKQVQKLDGHIHFESSPEGTTFYIDFPQAPS